MEVLELRDIVVEPVAVRRGEVEAIRAATRDDVGIIERLAQVVDGGVKGLVDLIIDLWPERRDDLLFAHRTPGIEQEEEEFHRPRLRLRVIGRSSRKTAGSPNA